MPVEQVITLSDGRRVSIRAASFLARVAAQFMRAKQVAMVLGSTIHLHGVSVAGFLSNKQWVRHELCHIDQYRRYGMLRFLLLYLIESVRRGYEQNRFEVEARAAEEQADF